MDYQLLEGVWLILLMRMAIWATTRIQLNNFQQEGTKNNLNAAYYTQPLNPEAVPGGKIGDIDTDLLSEDAFHNDSRNFCNQASLHLFTDKEKAQLANLEEGQGDDAEGDDDVSRSDMDRTFDITSSMFCANNNTDQTFLGLTSIATRKWDVNSLPEQQGK